MRRISINTEFSALNERHRRYAQLMAGRVGQSPSIEAERSWQLIPALEVIRTSKPVELVCLTILLAQIGWPLPICLLRLIPLGVQKYTFAVETGRYLLRHDPITVLEAAKHGARIEGLSCDRASALSSERRHENRNGEGSEDRYARWPVHPEPEKVKEDLSLSVIAADLKPSVDRWIYEQMVIWMQAGWPVPHALIRLYPRYWMTHHFALETVGRHFRRSKPNVLDLVAAGVRIKGVSRSALETLINAHGGEIEELGVGVSHHISRYFPSSLTDSSQYLVADILSADMRRLINGRDSDPTLRLTVEHLYDERPNQAASQKRGSGQELKRSIPNEKSRQDTRPYTEPDPGPDEPREQRGVLNSQTNALPHSDFRAALPRPDEGVSSSSRAVDFERSYAASQNTEPIKIPATASGQRTAHTRRYAHESNAKPRKPALLTPRTSPTIINKEK